MTFLSRFLSRKLSNISNKNILYPSYNNRTKINWAESKSAYIHKPELIFPVFISCNDKEYSSLDHLPLNYRVGTETILKYLDPLVTKGLESVMLFGNVKDALKDEKGSTANSIDNSVIRSIPLLRKAFPHLNIICDVCLCAYTSSGQCYITTKNQDIDKEASLIRLSEIALSYAQAGCDIVAPSDMIDNRVHYIKTLLTENHLNTSIMSYSGKLSSSFYGPFRDAASSGCNTPSRRNQLPPGSSHLAIRATQRDIYEGNDYIIIKPGLHGLDLILSTNIHFPHYPLFAYHVSGECAMLFHASQHGALDFEKALIETMKSFKRAGCTGIITYMVPQLMNIL